MLTLHQNFCEFDEFNQFISAWDVDFRQIGPGSLNAHLTQIVGNRVALARARFDRKAYQQGSSVPGMRTFGFVSASAPDVVWCNGVLSQGSLAIFAEDCDFRSVSPPGFFVYTLSLNEGELKRAASRLRVPVSSMKLKTRDEIRQVDPDRIRILGAIVDGYLKRFCAPNTVAAIDDQLQQQMTERLAEQLVDLLQEHGTNKPFPPRSRLTDTTNPVLHYIEQHLGSGVTVSDVAKSAGVSRRKLEYMFRRQLDVSPKSFINEQRLIMARRELLLYSGNESIADIANRWGFWHMGQFAKDYRLRFGELPSETAQQ